MPKIHVKCTESYNYLLESARELIVRRQVQLFDGSLFNLVGNYYSDELKTLPSITIQLLFSPTEADRDYLITLRAEIYKILSYLSASQLNLNISRANFGPVGFGVDYNAQVMPTEIYSAEGFDQDIRSMDCPGMAQLAIGCYLNLQKLQIRACQYEGIHFEPEILNIRYYSRDKTGPKRVAVLVNVSASSRLTIEHFKKIVIQTYFDSEFIRKTLTRYKFVIVRN